MILTNRALLPLVDTLLKLNAKTLSIKLKYQIAKNLLILDPLRQAFIAALQIDIQNGKEYLFEEKNGASKAELDLKYPGVYEALKTKEREINELFDLDVEVDLLALSIRDFPGEIDIDLRPLMPILEE